MRFPLLTLGAADPGRLFPTVLPWLLAIVGFAIVGTVVIMIVRRAFRADSSGDAQGFTLQSLREMRDQGQMSEEEYQRAREAMIGRIKREVDESKAAKDKPIESTTGDGRLPQAPRNGESDKPVP